MATAIFTGTLTSTPTPGGGSYWLVDSEAPVTLTAYPLVGGDDEVVADGGGVVALMTASHRCGSTLTS
jgi:hypothetical protein